MGKRGSALWNSAIRQLIARTDQQIAHFAGDTSSGGIKLAVARVSISSFIFFIFFILSYSTHFIVHDLVLPLSPLPPAMTVSVLVTRPREDAPSPRSPINSVLFRCRALGSKAVLRFDRVKQVESMRRTSVPLCAG